MGERLGFEPHASRATVGFAKKTMRNFCYHLLLSFSQLSKCTKIWRFERLVIKKYMPSVLWRCWLGGRKGIGPVKTEWWDATASVVICLGRGADLPADATATHCLLLQEIQIGFGFTFLVPAYPRSPGQNPESCKMVVVVIVLLKSFLGEHPAPCWVGALA